MGHNIYDLEVWKKGREFRKEISELTKTFPKDEKYRLVDQMIRASRSITANVAEGHGRFHYQENTQFCRQARGSLVEMYDHLVVALDEGFIDDSQFNVLFKKYEELIKMINGYISYLQRRKNEK